MYTATPLKFHHKIFSSTIYFCFVPWKVRHCQKPIKFRVGLHIIETTIKIVFLYNIKKVKTNKTNK